MSRILKSSGAAGLATLISRILGYVREWSYSIFLGTGPIADAFFTAFMIPNLFRRLLGEGALTAGFIPIFKEMEAAGDTRGMWRATNAVLSAVSLACATVCALGMIGITVFLWSVDRHWFDLEIHHELLLHLMRAMFPYLLLVCVAAVLIGVLNARGSFFLPAMGGTMLNVVMIASVFIVAPRFGIALDQQVFGLAAGVLVAGTAQALFQLPALWKDGYRWEWVSPWNDPVVREVVRRMAPATIGVAAFQLNVVVTNLLALHTGKALVSSFNSAVRLMELPQGVFGISMATFLLTELSGLAAKKKYSEFRNALIDGVRYLIFLNALASVLLCVLAVPIMRLLFQYGRFDQDSTHQASFALQCLAPGLLVFSLINVVARAFYALGDTMTPMKISIAALVLNLMFVFFLLPMLRQGGMGIANTMSAFINLALLTFALKKKLPSLAVKELLPLSISVLLAAGLAGTTAWILSQNFERRWKAKTEWPLEKEIRVRDRFGKEVLRKQADWPARWQAIQWRALGFGVPGVAATIVYFGATLAMGLSQPKEIAKVLMRKKSAEPPLDTSDRSSGP